MEQIYPEPTVNHVPSLHHVVGLIFSTLWTKEQCCNRCHARQSYRLMGHNYITLSFNYMSTIYVYTSRYASHNSYWKYIPFLFYFYIFLLLYLFCCSAVLFSIHVSDRVLTLLHLYLSIYILLLLKRLYVHFT